jgi:two-component system, NarL family, invasion response regulator UvrY
MKRKIKVILVDDHAVVRAGFRMLLATNNTIEVTAEAEQGEQAIQLAQDTAADVIIMDLSMPGIGGLETIRRICQRNSNVKILVFSVHDEQVYVNRAINAGAKGYITKNSAVDILLTAIEQIAAGNNYIEAGLIKTPSCQLVEQDYQCVIDEFSPREFDVFLLLAKGLTVHKIADELCLGHKTISNYSTQIKKKLQVASIAKLAHIALILGVIRR